MRRRKPKPVTICRYTADGRRMVGHDSKGKPATDEGKVSGWSYAPEDLPVHSGGCKGLPAKEAAPEPPLVLPPLEPVCLANGHAK